MITITLINSKVHLSLIGIIVGEDTWIDDISNKLIGYIAWQSWCYLWDDNSTLQIQIEEGTEIPDNITDFGELV